MPMTRLPESTAILQLLDLPYRDCDTTIALSFVALPVVSEDPRSDASFRRPAAASSLTPGFVDSADL